ncbi:S66 peptidase family protein [Kushneria indalinina]|uniref:Murein tetrapeptidase LD-carboxypeptidase n=1 Tax=Kushneria indalinina DSM 14324 TaxID=1122140 RepID=A0A3D9DXE1_9GAMM|nr:LD-carboxypeptidase [Kushneria indalinina]REC95450.1 murein tetrapeptidase LD-carboxypeptidase [Kushneria indalinina DSM 14324]
MTRPIPELSELRPLGDGPRLVALIAPAGAVLAERIDTTCALLTAMGYTPRLMDNARARHRYLAGTVEQRLEDFHAAFNLADVAAVWCLRGGYGCAQLIDHINWDALPDVPLLGYSDISVLLSAFHARVRRAIHAPVATELALCEQTDGLERQARLEAMASIAPLLAGESGHMSAEHAAGPTAPVEGVLIGGNLTTLASVAGTPAALHVPEGSILMLEDVGERLYRLERSLCQLLESLDASRLNAVCLGSFTGCDSGDSSIEAVLEEWLAPHDIALYHHLPFGHGEHNRAWPVGQTARLDASGLDWSPASTL